MTKGRYSFSFIPSNFGLSTQDIKKVFVTGSFINWNSQPEEFELLPLDNTKEFWYKTLTLPITRYEYKFTILTQGNNLLWIPEGPNLILNPDDIIPISFQGHIFYQIMPDRIRNNYKIALPPTYNKKAGGTLSDISNLISKGYFNKLSSENEDKIIFYLTPLHHSPSSYHKYWPEDHTKIDKELGGIDQLKELISTIQSKNMKIIIDIVFNHMGFNHFAFQDILRYNKLSSYFKWLRNSENIKEEKIKIPLLGKIKDIEIINDPRRESFNPEYPSYAIVNKIFKLPIRNYADMHPLKTPTSYALLTKSDITLFSTYALNPNNLLAEELPLLYEYFTLQYNQVISDAITLEKSWIEHKPLKNYTYPLSEWGLLNAINEYLISKGRLRITTLDVVNSFRNQVAKLDDLTPQEILELHFGKSIGNISELDILTDQPFYELTKDELNYKAWFNLFELPELNTLNPETRKYLFKSGNMYIELNIDGFRLDVPDTLHAYDNTFWQEFINKVAKNKYILAEIWQYNEILSALRDPSRPYTVTMNYPLRTSIINAITSYKIREANDEIVSKGSSESICNVSEIVKKFIKDIGKHRLELMYNLISSHDTRRINAFFNLETNSSEFPSIKKEYEALLILYFTLPGIPSIYYGDELGLTGLLPDGIDNRNVPITYRGMDPHNRAPFPYEEVIDDIDNTKYYPYFKLWQKIIKIYLTNNVLSIGDYYENSAGCGSRVLSYYRSFSDKDYILVLVSNSPLKQVSIPLHSKFKVPTTFVDLISGRLVRSTSNNSINLPFDIQRGYILKPIF